MSIPFRSLGQLCEREVLSLDPKQNPERDFWYIDISAVDNVGKKIATPQKLKGKQASSRARQVIRTNDVLVSTTRPNLNAVALVQDKYDGQIASTGFCVLRPGPELEPEYLFAFVQSEAFIQPLTELVKGALYPAVTDKQVYGLEIPWVPLNTQRLIAAQLKAQLAAIEEARQAAEVQLRDTRLLCARMFRAFFAEVDEAPKKRLGDYAHITSGVTPARDNWSYWQPAEVAWVKTGEIDFSPITSVKESISKKAMVECSLTLLPPKTVLIAITGEGKTRGRSAVLEISATTNQHSVAVLPNETWDANFLQLWMQSSYSGRTRTF